MASLLDREYPQYPGFWDAPFSPEMIAQQSTTGSPRVSPDGRFVAYSRDRNQRVDLWVMDSDGANDRQVTADAPTIAATNNPPFSGSFGGGFLWTADSAELIYTSSRDGKLYRVARNGGRATRISDGAGTHLGPQLSRDGSFIAYTVDRGDVDDNIYVAVSQMDNSTGTQRRLTPSNVVAMDAQISPDGSRIACVLNPLDDRWAHDAQIAVIELASGRIDVLTPTASGVNVMPRWSPDGETLAFISDRSGYLNVYTMPAGGGEPTPVAPEEHEHMQLAWSPDGSRIAYLRNALADTQVIVVNVASGEQQRVSTRSGVHSSVSWLPDGDAICALHQSPCHAPDVVIYSLNGGDRQLTWSAPGGLDDPDLFVMPEHVTWQSTDGLEIPGLILTPKRVIPNGHPVLVHVHGGPTSQFQMTWDPMSQYFVARGWAVVKPNYRGSMGYGRKFTDLLHGAWGQGDLHDNVTSVNALRERGLVDERRVAVWGSSAGGYATLSAMTMAPGAFKAGVAMAAPSDMFTFTFTSDRYGRDLPRAEMGPSREHYDLWAERSPLTHVERVTHPLLLLHGLADKRVHPSQSEMFVEAMRKAGKVAEYQTYEGEGHSLRKCDNIRDYITRMEDFLTRHVLLL